MFFNPMESFSGWAISKNGLLVPYSSRKPLSHRETIKWSDIKSRALQVASLFAKHNYKLTSGEAIGRLIKNATSLADKYEKGRRDIPEEWQLDTLSLLRVSKALLPVSEDLGILGILKKLRKGELGLLHRGKSDAKDKLWEIEVYRKSKDGLLDTSLEEPDVVWRDGDMVAGVACKRVYKEKNFKASLMDAVHQIEGSTKYGFVAVSLDDLVPVAILSADNSQMASSFMQEFNSRFLQRQQKHIKKYFSTDRLTGVIINTTCVADLKDVRMKFVLSESTVWTVPGLSEVHRKRIERFWKSIADTPGMGPS